MFLFLWSGKKNYVCGRYRCGFTWLYLGSEVLALQKKLCSLYSKDQREFHKNTNSGEMETQFKYSILTESAFIWILQCEYEAYSFFYLCFTLSSGMFQLYDGGHHCGARKTGSARGGNPIPFVVCWLSFQTRQGIKPTWAGLELTTINR